MFIVILLVLALLCFLAATFNAPVPFNGNLVALGLALVTAAWLFGGTTIR